MVIYSLMEISNLRDKYISQIKESSELENQINILKKKDLLLKMQELLKLKNSIIMLKSAHHRANSIR